VARALGYNQGVGRIEVQPGALGGGSDLHRRAAYSVREMAGALDASCDEAETAAVDAPGAASAFAGVHGPAMAQLAAAAEQAAENLAAAAGVYAETDERAIEGHWS